MDLQDKQSAGNSNRSIFPEELEFKGNTEGGICVNFDNGFFLLVLLEFGNGALLVGCNAKFDSIGLAGFSVAEEFELKEEVYIGAVFEGNLHYIFAGDLDDLEARLLINHLL